MNTEEQWRPVVGWETYYEVSNHGRLRRTKAGKGARHMKASLGNPATTGYFACTLTRNGRCYRRYMHRLICEAFLSNPDGKKQVNHIDGNKQNNMLPNLEWATPRENLLHRSRVLGLEIGETHHAAKFTKGEVLKIRGLIAEGRSNASIARDMGVSRKNISCIKNGSTWSHFA